MTSFENNFHHRLCLFCCKSINYNEIENNYEGYGEGDYDGRGDYFNFDGDTVEKPLVSKIIDSEDSFGEFMEMLGRYSGGVGVNLTVGLKLKELNLCENCLLIINRCGELYDQLKCIEKEIEWKVGSVMEIMKVGSGRIMEGKSTYFGGIRKEIMNNCFKMLGGLEKMELSPKPESPLPLLPPTPPIMPLPRKRDKCVEGDKIKETTDTIADAAPAPKRSRIMTKENMKQDKDAMPKIIPSAKEIPLDNNNNSNEETVAMDTFEKKISRSKSSSSQQAEEPEESSGPEVTFTLSRLQINKDPFPNIGAISSGPAFRITGTGYFNEGARRRAHHATTNQIN